MPAMRCVGAWGLLTLAACGVAAGLDGPDARSIETYLERRHFQSDNDRNYARFGVEPIENLIVLGRLPWLRFYVFPTSASSLTGHVPVVVTDRGEVFEVGDTAAFNRLMRREPVVVLDAHDAEGLARDYLRLRFIHAQIWEGVEGGVNFIRGVEDIPFTEGDAEHDLERLDLELHAGLQPVSVEMIDRGFVLHGYSWAPFGGEVEEHTVTVFTDGTIEHERKSLASPYGKYLTGCTVPLDSGPRIGVMARLATHPGGRARRAVVAYIRHLTMSQFLLHREVVRDHPEELVEIVRDLAIDPDSGIAAAALELLSRLALWTETSHDRVEPADSETE